jgi:DNA-binding CsgD family transcriptional regulator
MLDSVEHVGVDTEGVCAGLPFDGASVRRLRHVDWEDYVVVCERLTERLGGESMAEACAEQAYPHVGYEMRTLAGAFVSPMIFLRLINELMVPAMYSSMICSFAQLGPDRAQISIRTRPGASGSLAVFKGTTGAMRAVPQHLGLPAAIVKADVGPTYGHYDVQLPPSRTIPARIGRALSGRMAFSVVVGRDPDGHEISATFGNSGHDDAERRLADAIVRWRLSPRQAQVLARVAQGEANKEIAAALSCAENTVELHMTQVMRKADVTSRAQLIARFWSAK